MRHATEPARNPLGNRSLRAPRPEENFALPGETRACPRGTSGTFFPAEISPRAVSFCLPMSGAGL
jgi:hypothetical protein